MLSLLTQGVSPEAILDDYPVLELEDIFACTAYARAAIERENPAPATAPREWKSESSRIAGIVAGARHGAA